MATTAKKTTEVATKATSEISTNVVLDFAADAGLGMEGADKNSFAIPFITLLQGLSPQLETVEGARPGLFINTITNELYKEVLVVPCAYQRRFLRWAPRDQGGGYKGEFNPIDIETGKVAGVETNAEGRLTLEGDLLNDTRNHFVLVQSSTGAWQPALVSLSSTQIKKSKRWMSRIQGIELRNGAGRPFNPPSFSHVYKLKAIKEENSKGSWWGLGAELVEPVGDADLYHKAKDFHASVACGAVEVAPPPDEGASDAPHDDRF